MLSKIVSGGQTGATQGGCRVLGPNKVLAVEAAGQPTIARRPTVRSKGNVSGNAPDLEVMPIVVF